MEAFLTGFGMYGLIVTYILIAIATLGFVGFELFHLATNLRDSKGQLIGFGALVVIMALGWVLASGDFTFPGIEKFEISESTIRLIDMGIIVSYVLLAIASIGLVVDLVLGSVKK